MTVLDDSEYDETIRLADPQRFAGVQLLAPQHAKLRSSALPPAVVHIRGIPDFKLEGFTIEAPQAQHAIEINGECPGLQLESIQIERTDNAPGREGSVAALVLCKGAAGTAERPISVRNLTLRSTNVGIVVGSLDPPEAPPPRHILIERCLVQGLSSETSTNLALIHRSEDLVIRENIFAQGMQGLSILTNATAAAQRPALPVNSQIVHNTWHDLQSWLVWTGPATEPMSMQVHHNLIVDAKWISPETKSLTAAAAAPAVFENNLRVTRVGAAGDSFAPAATESTEFPLLSVDPADPNYLKPDFARLQAGGSTLQPVPGRYSEADSP